MNRLQVDITRSEKQVRDAILEASVFSLAAGQRAPLRFLIKPTRGYLWYASDLLSPVYARTWFGRDDVSFRMVRYAADVPEDNWPIRLGDTEAANANLIESVPYTQLRVMEITDNGGYQLLDNIDDKTFAGLQVQWVRETPIYLARIPQGAPCPFRWSADQDAMLKGWSAPEQGPRGSVRWLLARTATITLPNACSGARQLMVAVDASARDSLEGIELVVNGVVAATAKQPVADGLLLQIQLRPTYNAKTIHLELRAPRPTWIDSPRIGIRGIELERVP
jgi:hypothetical protein